MALNLKSIRPMDQFQFLSTEIYQKGPSHALVSFFMYFFLFLSIYVLCNDTRADIIILLPEVSFV